jgi:hypothetical protein
MIASPSGSRIAWVFDSQGRRNIWVAEGPQFQARQLTSYDKEDGQEITSLEFTTNGNSIVYVRGGDRNQAGEIPNPTSDPGGQTQAVWAVSWADGKTRMLTPPPETVNGIQKQMSVSMSESGIVLVNHKITNIGRTELELAPWALTVMAQGGRAILPQEKFIPHTEYLLPARPLVLWHYTQMADPRWIWGNKYIQLRQDPKAATPQKCGLLNKQGWAAYALNGDLFVKRYKFDENGKYPDFGCNTECFTNADICEVETLGPLTKLAPDGGFVQHEETWSLHKAQLTEDEASIDQAMKSIL